MATFDVGEFFRKKRLQDQINSSDSTYDPDSTTAWLEHATKFPTSPDVSEVAKPQDSNPIPSTNNSIQFPQFTPDAAQAIGPTQPDQFKAPNIGPEEQAYREQLGQTPLRSNDRPGMLRKILGGVAGIGVGLHTSDPEKAGQAVENITHAPYYQQLQNFNQGLGIQQQKAQAEIGDVSRAATQQEQLARTGAEKARMEQEAAHRKQLEYQNSPEGRDFQLQLAGVKKTGDNSYEAMDKDNNLMRLEEDPKSHRLVNVDDGIVVDIKALKRISDRGKSLRETQANAKITNPFELWTAQNPEKDVEEWFKLPQNKPTKGEWEDYKAEYLAANPKGSIRQAIKDFESLKAYSSEKPPQVLMVNPADSKTFVARPGTVLPPGARTATQEGLSNTPTTQTRGKAEQANTVIHTGEDIKQYIDAHKDKLGRIGDYWQQMVSGTPIADPDIAEFQTLIASYAALQAAAHGFRGANVMKDFESKIGGPARNPEAIKRAIDGIAKTMSEIQKTGGQSNNVPSPVATHRYNPATGKIEAK